MELIRANSIQLLWDGSKICALVGDDLQQGRGGFGDNVPEALRDLAGHLEADDITVWVPQRAKQYIDTDGLLKAACPECGAIHAVTPFAAMLAFICGSCGASIDCEPLQDPLPSNPEDVNPDERED